jgi:hypothetical protein
VHRQQEGEREQYDRGRRKRETGSGQTAAAPTYIGFLTQR